MSDRATDGPLEEAWLSFGRNLAVCAGALIALVSLLLHRPVWVATLRGALTFAGAWIVVLAARVVLRATSHAKPKNASGATPRKNATR